jgi:tetratricopeptide (TPR) repeat protein
MPDRQRYDGSLPMRWLILALAVLLVVPGSAGAQQAWAKAYEDGVKAFEDGNDAIAEQKLKEAREHDRAPKQSRRANFYSVVYRPFIPDFYLGVIYARQGRLKQAQEYLERAVRDELVKQDDRANYALATTTLERIRSEQTRLASNRATPPPEVRPTPPPTTATSTSTPPPATTTTPTNPATQTPSNNAANTATSPTVRPLPPVNPPVNPPATVEPAWLPRFRQTMEAARAALRQSRYTEARSSLDSATAVAGDPARRQEADVLRRAIDTAQNVAAQGVVARARDAIRRKDTTAATFELAALRELAPDHAAAAELRRGINALVDGLDRTAKLANAERTGVKLFLSGNYQESAAALERAVGSGITSPRIYLFLASSRAAEALLAPQADQPRLIAEAKKHYQQAKPDAATLRADQRFISPSILDLLSGS